MFQARCAELPHTIAYEAEDDAGIWHATTYSEYGELVERAALGLRDLGIGEGDCVAIFGDTVPEWSILNLGAQAAGAHIAGIYQTSTAEQAVYIIHDSSAKICCVDTPERLEILLSRRDELPHVTTFIYWGDVLPDDNAVLSYEQVLASGEKIKQTSPDSYGEMVAAISPEAYAVLVYTSGTTGMPKGVILTHGNCMANVHKLNEHGIYHADDSLIAFLPMSHVAEYLTWVGRVMGGLTAYFCPDFSKIGKTILDKQPTILVAVPRVYEKVYQKIISSVENSSEKKKQIFNWAWGVGAAASKYTVESKSLPLGLAIKHRIADKLVLSKVRAQLGGKVRMCVTAAAPMDSEIMSFFWAFGLPMLEAYGLSESCGASHINVMGSVKIGTVGRALNGIDCRIAEDGEVLMRGDSIFKGYLNKPEATSEAINAEGWFQTGDIGEIDEDGFLRITDRKKNLIITAGGKNVAPNNSELLIKREPLVSQVVVLGDRKPYLIALITLATDVAKAEGLGDHEIHERLQAAIDKANGQLAKYERVQKYHLLDEEFTVESGEMTPTMKIKRNVVANNHADVVERLYGEVKA